MTPYRAGPRRATTEEERPAGPITRIDVSGRAGMDGSPGRRGSDGRWSGEDGGDGGDAGPAEPGQPGGTLRVLLKPHPDEAGAVWITGFALDGNGVQRKINESRPIGDTGTIDLLAAGGAGGAGGVGGRGGDGAAGSSGSDATRYSSGTDGGPGGDGGDGGNGSNGAPGGRGGHVVVEVSDDDTHLLVLARHEIHGGRGGVAGQNGDGGDGGRGGPGGSSYSWTETESYTDSNGQSRTRTTHHSNPGGSRGRSGRSGRPGLADLVPGRQGGPGTFAIHVTSPSGTRAYPSRFDLRLVSFVHASANDDDVYEPEEKVHVRRIEIQNTGGMPTPSRREIRLTLRDKGWIAADPGHLVAPPSLAPGARHVFETEELTFTLGAFHPSRPSDPLAEEQVIHHRAFVPDANRELGDYESAASVEMGRFTVRFPVEVTPLESLPSLAPGSAARVRFRITNVSGRAFGERSEIGRAVSFRLFLHESELDAGQLLFFDGSGARVDLDRGYRAAIPALAPGASVDVEGTLAVSEDAAHYRAGRVWLSLDLGGIDAPLRVRPIQYRELGIRVARPFVQDRPTDVLLAVNNRTTAEEVSAWEALAASLGLTIGVFDLSLEGGLDLDATVGGRSLGDLLAGRTLVVLNSPMDTPRGARPPARHLAKEQVLAHAARRGHVLIVGDPVGLESLLVPTRPRDRSQSAVPESVFREALSSHGEQGLAIGGPPAVVDAGKWSVLFWGAPTEEALRDRAHDLAAALREAHPERRYVLVCDLAPEQKKDYAVCKRWKMGKIAVFRTLDAARGAVATVAAPERRVHAAELITGRASTMSLLLALPFEEKLRRFEALASAGAAAGEPGAAEIEEDEAEEGSVSRSLRIKMVVDAMLVDLANEQLAVLHTGSMGRASAADLRASLPLLGHLAAALSTRGAQEELTVPRSVHLLRLLGRLRFFAATQPRWWEWVPPFPFTRRAPVLRRVTSRIVEEIALRALVGPDTRSAEGRARRKAVEAEIAAVRESLVRRWREARAEHLAPARKALFARQALLRPIEREGVTTDAEVLLAEEERVLTREMHRSIAVEDGKRAARRRTLVASMDQARAALLRKETCAELLRAAGGEPEPSGPVPAPAELPEAVRC